MADRPGRPACRGGTRSGPRPAATPGRAARVWFGLTFLEPFGQDPGQLGPHSWLSPDQPLKVLAAQPEQPAGFGAPHGGQTGVAVTASPVTRGELAKMLTRAEGADHPVLDEDLVMAGKRDVEEPVRIPPADDLLTGGHVDAGAAVTDRLDDRIGHPGQQGHDV